MRVYISGPITDNLSYKEDFARAENYLRTLGHIPLNPCKPEGWSYKDYMDMCLAELSKCDAIYMLWGWAESKGSRLEFDYAAAVGLKIFFEEASDVQAHEPAAVPGTEMGAGPGSERGGDLLYGRPESEQGAERKRGRGRPRKADRD